MCGIAGGLGALGPDVTPLKRMVDALHLRGPDDSGTEVIQAGDAVCWLGNTRLSIQDLSKAGHMPMQDRVTRNWITYNGEIYNFKELRRGLQAKGEAFVSGTDTEVLLRLYRREGSRALARLRGMFAFAIWDDEKRELFLARDRVGKKPLYYTCGSGRFLFSSEIRSLMASGLIERRLDRDGLALYLANGFLVSPVTILEGVLSLLPGHWMRVGADGRILEMRSYWNPQAADEADRGEHPEDLEALRGIFQDAVTARLVSDVPVGVFLSGGMDSSAIVGAVSRHHEQVRTFSIGFPGSDLDESDVSRAVASHWKTDHREVSVGAGEFLAWLPQALEAMDQPTYDGVNSYFVSRAAHDADLKVVLSGIGADELFGGYPSFRSVPLMRLLGSAATWLPSLYTLGGMGRAASRVLDGDRPASWRRITDLLGVRWGRAARSRFQTAFYQVTQILFPSHLRERLLAEPAGSDRFLAFPARFGLPIPFARSLEVQLEGCSAAAAFSLLAWRLFLGERCLRDVDSMSMGVSLEVRAPFTDQEFVEAIMRYPAGRRCAGPPDKPFERRLLDPFLKDAWPARSKQGFVMPFTSWLGTEQGEARIDEVLMDAALLNSLGLDPGSVADLWRRHRRTPDRVPWSAVWAVFVLAAWCRSHRVSL